MTGSTVMLAPDMNGADAAFPPAPSTWIQRFPWMGRYVSSPDSNPKNLKQAEVDAIAAVDGGIAYFVEQSESTVLGGDAGNRALARQAVKLADRFGLPAGCPFWYAVDVAPNGRYDVIARSFEVYNEETPDHWPVAGYVGSRCGDFLLERGLIQYMHLPGATSWWEGYRSPNAHLRQYPSEPYAGTRIDRNDVLLPTPMWFPGREAAEPKENDMTPDECRAIVDPQFAAIWEVLTKPPAGTDPPLPSMQWSTFLTWDTVAKGQLAKQIAAAVVAALPPSSGGGGITEAQMVQAVLTALRRGTE